MPDLSQVEQFTGPLERVREWEAEDPIDGEPLGRQGNAMRDELLAALAAEHEKVRTEIATRNASLESMGKQIEAEHKARVRAEDLLKLARESRDEWRQYHLDQVKRTIAARQDTHLEIIKRREAEALKDWFVAGQEAMRDRAERAEAKLKNAESMMSMQLKQIQQAERNLESLSIRFSQQFRAREQAEAEVERMRRMNQAHVAYDDLNIPLLQNKLTEVVRKLNSSEAEVALRGRMLDLLNPHYPESIHGEKWLADLRARAGGDE